MRDFRPLQVWEKAHELTLHVYRLTTAFPDDERFGLVSQLRRAAASIPTNIAEGCGRATETDFARFLDIASGSASETEYLLILAYDLSYVHRQEYERVQRAVEEVKRMLGGLLASIRR